jgi:VanZ family protein
MSADRGWPPPGARWAAWLAFAVLWTLTLLTTFPITARDAVVRDEGVGFTAGKSLHVVGYALFALLTAWLPAPRRVRWGLLAFVAAHAAGTEYLQQFVDRSASLEDVGLDLLGIVLGVALTWRRWLGAGDPGPRP